ncbi:NADPH-dependent FMN reductase [Crenothrix sp.]|uniref:NADPH-dependent FMN reductase n=1 Tax=Crenothrix sp. TaxID=3100433 RepID=UPI00374CD2BF
MSKILAFAGSTRKDSFNKKLVKIAAIGAETVGAEVNFIDLADFPMPLFDQDLEQKDGMPSHAKRFKNLLIAHDGFLIASPEYNSAFSAVLKNTIDWASRSEPTDETSLIAFQGKMAGIMATSPSALGGMRGLVHLRLLLSNIGVTVLPQQQTIPFALKAFDDKDALIDTTQHQAVMNLGIKLAQTLKKLSV